MRLLLFLTLLCACLGPVPEESGDPLPPPPDAGVEGPPSPSDAGPCEYPLGPDRIGCLDVLGDGG